MQNVQGELKRENEQGKMLTLDKQKGDGGTHTEVKIKWLAQRGVV